MSRDVVISVRMTEEEAEFLRWRAAAAGRSVSDEVRGALSKLPPWVVPQDFTEYQLVRRQVGWKCAHGTVTYAAGTGVPRLWCGCVMTPVYADQTSVAS